MTQLQTHGTDAQHTADSSEWYTPSSYVSRARAALGTIVLDPATCVAAQRIVRARTYFTPREDGLKQDWSFARTIFLNPPTPPREWGERLAAWHAEDPTRKAIFVSYAIATLARSTVWKGLPLGLCAWPTVLLSRRIEYLTNPAERIRSLETIAADPERRKLTPYEREDLLPWLRSQPADALIAGSAPSHESAIVGFGLTAEEMQAHFGDLGTVVQAMGGRR